MVGNRFSFHICSSLWSLSAPISISAITVLAICVVTQLFSDCMYMCFFQEIDPGCHELFDLTLSRTSHPFSPSLIKLCSIFLLLKRFKKSLHDNPGRISSLVNSICVSMKNQRTSYGSSFEVNFLFEELSLKVSSLNIPCEASTFLYLSVISLSFSGGNQIKLRTYL